MGNAPIFQSAFTRNPNSVFATTRFSYVVFSGIAEGLPSPSLHLYYTTYLLPFQQAKQSFLKIFSEVDKNCYLGICPL